MTKKEECLNKSNNAHTNLTMFHAVIQLMEGGLIYGGGNIYANKIITIARTAAMRELRKLDKARAVVLDA
ncbi:MAG: hypothetical protein WC594_01715 [Thermodesulfovibrionales bacterium]